jgi:hypothetical protein
MTRLVSDQVWQQLDPAGGRVRRRTVLRFWGIGVPTIVVLFAAAAAWAAGSVVPWLHETDSGLATSVALDDANGRTGPRPAEQTMNLHIQNDGEQAVRIVGVGGDHAGIRMLRATAEGRPITPRSPYVLDPAHTVEITMFLQFTDCAAVSTRPWPIPVRVARPWGTQTVHVLHLPIRATSDHGGWSLAYRGDPRAVEWQRWIADDVCAVPYSRRAPANR